MSQRTEKDIKQLIKRVREDEPESNIIVVYDDSNGFMYACRITKHIYRALSNIVKEFLRSFEK